MTTLFGKRFDPMRAQTPLARIELSGFWLVLSVVWIDVTWSRVRGLKTMGRPVSGFQYATVGFWFVILIFWCWNGLAGLRKYWAESASGSQ